MCVDKYVTVFIADGNFAEAGFAHKLVKIKVFRVALRARMILL